MQFELAPGREAVYFDTARPLTSFLHVSEIIASTYMVWGFWGDRTFFWHAFSWLFVSALLVRMCRGAGPRSAAAAVLPRHFPPPLPPAPEAWQNAPAEFICPITRGLMLLPVITPLGTSYEWEALAGWIGANHRYPSGEGGELLLEMLAPNLALRNLIEKWIAEQRHGADGVAPAPPLPPPPPSALGQGGARAAETVAAGAPADVAAAGGQPPHSLGEGGGGSTVEGAAPGPVASRLPQRRGSKGGGSPGADLTPSRPARSPARPARERRRKR